MDEQAELGAFFSLLSKSKGWTFSGETGEAAAVMSIEVELTAEVIDAVHKIGFLRETAYVGARPVGTGELDEESYGRGARLEVLVSEARRLVVICADESSYIAERLTMHQSGSGLGNRPYVLVDSGSTCVDPGVGCSERVKTALTYERAFDFLRRAADYFASGDYVFLKGEVVKIPGRIQNLSGFPSNLWAIEELGELIHDVESEDHRDVRISIFRSVVVDLLRAEREERRLEYFVRNTKQVRSAFRASFDLYMERFSFDKLRTEFERDALAMLGRLGDAIAAVRGQVVMIGTAAIAISQFSSGEWLRNSLILAAILLASILYQIVIRNQLDVVGEVEEEIGQQRKLLESAEMVIKHPEISGRLSGLEKKVRVQRKRMQAFTVVLWSSFAISMVLYVVISLSGTSK